MAEKTNAYCRICGNKFYVCKSCSEAKINPWRLIADSMEHYQIHLALKEFNENGDKAAAKKMLEKCDLSDMDTFKESIKPVITDIMGKTVTKASTTKATTAAKTTVDDKTEKVEEAATK